MNYIAKTGMPTAAVATLDMKKISAETNGGTQDVEKVGREFESFFLYFMLKELDKITHVEKKSYMSETYRTIAYEKVGEYLAKKGIGIREMLVKYMENK